MGSGKKLRCSWDYDFYALGIVIIPKSEHTVSIHINLVVFSIYIGLGKGYDEL